MGYDYVEDPDYDAIEAQLDNLRYELEELEGVRERGDDWAVAMNNDHVVPFVREQFQKSYALLEAGNTAQFVSSLESVDVNMQDPEDQNTFVNSLTITHLQSVALGSFFQ